MSTSPNGTCADVTVQHPERSSDRVPRGECDSFGMVVATCVMDERLWRKTASRRRGCMRVMPCHWGGKGGLRVGCCLLTLVVPYFYRTNLVRGVGQ